MRMKMDQMKQKQNKRLFFVVFCLFVGCIAMMSLCAACGQEEITVTIRDGKNETTVTAYTRDTVESILEEAEITLGENDEVTPELDYKMTADDTTIVISRYAAVTIQDGDDTYELELVGATVGDALEEAGLVLGEDDITDQEPDVYLTDGMVIAILRTTREQIVEEEEIAYETTYEDSSSIYKGETSVKQEGVNGVKEITYEVTYVSGEEVSREIISEEVTQEPVDEIILNGTKSKGKTVVSRQYYDDCDGSGHGYVDITYSDGSTERQEY